MAHFKCKVETNKTKEPRKHPKVYGRRKRTKAGIVRGGENTVGPLHLQYNLTGIHTESTRALLCSLCCSKKYFKSTGPVMDTIRHLQVVPASTHKHTNTLPFCEGLEHLYDAGPNAPWTPGKKATM